MFFSVSEGYNYKHKRNVFGHKATKILHQNIVLHSLSLSKYFFWENSPPKYFFELSTQAKIEFVCHTMADPILTPPIYSKSVYSLSRLKRGRFFFL